MTTKPLEMAEIDPMALVLRGDVYVHLHLPDPAPSTLRQKVRAQLKTMSARDRKAVVRRAAVLAEYASVLQEEARALDRLPIVR